MHKFFLTLIFTFALVKGFALNHDDASEGSQKFNISELIMHHISDEHGWSFTHDVKLPLPVILYVPGVGLDIFSSSNLDHGKVYKGYRNDHEHIVKVGAEGDAGHQAEIYDFSITKNVATMIFSAVLLLLIFSAVARGFEKNRGKAPTGIQSFLEPVIVYMRDEVVKPSIGTNYEKYFPYILTLFFFIFVNNVLGLLPGGPNLTGNIAITLVLAVITFLITNFSAKSTYWKHIFTPNVPVLMWPILIPVEIIGIFMKPLSLMIRLFANITAGHIIMLSLFGLIFIFQSYMVSPLVGIFALFMNTIELLVAFLQAFIFSLLTSMYIGTAVEEHH